MRDYYSAVKYVAMINQFHKKWDAKKHELVIPKKYIQHYRECERLIENYRAKHNVK